MAIYLCIFSAPDSHIEYLTNNPDTLWDYVDGKKPEPTRPQKQGILKRFFGGSKGFSESTKIPHDWPSVEVVMIGPEINHRNVDLYHRILNDGDEHVSGAGSIFQTWLSHQKHSAIDIGKHGENFAFTSEFIPELQNLTSSVDEDRVNRQYSAWLLKEGQEHAPAPEECSELAKEFMELASELQAISSTKTGLIWISS